MALRVLAILSLRRGSISIRSGREVSPAAPDRYRFSPACGESEEAREQAIVFGRSVKCDAVLARYGLDQSSMAIIGADRQPEFPDWRVMITGGGAPIYLNVRVATVLEADLRHIRETRLADRVAAAIKTAKTMRPSG